MHPDEPERVAEYVVGLRVSESPWHCLGRFPTLELAVECIHTDADSRGRPATGPLRPHGDHRWVSRANGDVYDVLLERDDDSEVT